VAPKRSNNEDVTALPRRYRPSARPQTWIDPTGYDGMDVAARSARSHPIFRLAWSRVAARSRSLPAGPPPPCAARLGLAAIRKLAYADCMRSHGLPNFPDARWRRL
jgi:hypothetical protein